LNRITPLEAPLKLKKLKRDGILYKNSLGNLF